MLVCEGKMVLAHPTAVNYLLGVSVWRKGTNRIAQSEECLSSRTSTSAGCFATFASVLQNPNEASLCCGTCNVQNMFNTIKKHLTFFSSQWYKKPDYNLFTPYVQHRRKNPTQPFYILHPKFIWQLWDIIQENTKEKIQPNPPSSGFIGRCIKDGPSRHARLKKYKMCMLHEDWAHTCILFVLGAVQKQWLAVGEWHSRRTRE